jgi:hypothetical protein
VLAVVAREGLDPGPGELAASLRREVAALRRADLPGSYRVGSMRFRVQKNDRGVLGRASYRDWMLAFTQFDAKRTFDHRQGNIRVFQSAVADNAWGVWLDAGPWGEARELIFGRGFQPLRKGGELLATEETWQGGEVARLSVTLDREGGLELKVVVELEVEARDYTALVTYTCRTAKGLDWKHGLSRDMVEKLENLALQI